MTIERGDIVKHNNGHTFKVYSIKDDYYTARYNLAYHKDDVVLVYKPYTPSLKFRKEEVRRCAERWDVKIKFED